MVMRIEKEMLEKIQSIAHILSSVAIPIVIAVYGSFIQKSISNDAIKKDYVQIALDVLKDEKQDKEIRKWAVTVLDKNAPVPFSSKMINKLEGGYPLLIRMPIPPEEFMSPPLKLKSLSKNDTTMTDLLQTINENYGRYHILAVKYRFLQRWIMDMDSLSQSNISDR